MSRKKSYPLRKSTAEEIIRDSRSFPSGKGRITSRYACAADAVYEDFMPKNFVFEYNDHNSTTYEGDSGLRVARVNNVFDNNSYF